MAGLVNVLSVVLFTSLSYSLLQPPAGAAAATAQLLTWKCDNGSYYAENSTYQSNTGSLLASLAANATASAYPVGFATAAVGAASPDAVWGLGLCRGDTNGTDCGSCLAQAPEVAFGNRCRGVKDVTVFYDRCILRYSFQDILASPDNGQVQIRTPSAINVTQDAGRFNALILGLVGALADWAAFNTSSRYAVGVLSSDQGFPATNNDVVHTINGLVQCTPDQEPATCRRCLQALIDEMPEVFNGSLGGRLLAVWCNLRFAAHEFYDGSPMLKLDASQFPPPPSPASTDQTGNGTRWQHHASTVSAIVLGVAVIILLIILTFFIWRNGRTKFHAEGPASLLFDLATLRDATNNFAEENKLGHGGFGAVYKGALPDGRQIAVKRLDKASAQGLKEARNELLLVARLRHNNLAKLLGVCLKGQEKLLVYEYLPNRSLDTFLFVHEKRQLLDWKTRYNIIYGTARGLLYLHEDSQIRIIHRDVKASNILLDTDMTAKISDFGLARLFESDKTSSNTSKVVGTLGYMAPEYAVLGHLSVKLDVYSFGVLVLEIITGKRNNAGISESAVEESSSVLNYVWDRWCNGMAMETVDPWLDCNQAPEGEVVKCIHLGLLCVQENPADRPTMLDVLVMLHGEAAAFPAPSKPAFAFSCGGELSSASASRPGNVPSSGGGIQGTAMALLSENGLSISDFDPR